MKKIILLIICLFIFTGCTNLQNDNLDNIVSEIQKSKINIKNEYRTGYKYYLPSNMGVVKSTYVNEILKNQNTKYYMYVDLVSYYNKKKSNYEINSSAFYSKDISYDNKPGFIEINSKNEKYLIEIMYNYAKIEVMVDKDMINETIANSLIILSSIKYNDDIIDNLMGENILNYREETFTIFDKVKNDSDFLEVIQEYDKYNEPKIPDYDLIN